MTDLFRIVIALYKSHNYCIHKLSTISNFWMLLLTNSLVQLAELGFPIKLHPKILYSTKKGIDIRKKLLLLDILLILNHKMPKDVVH